MNLIDFAEPGGKTITINMDLVQYLQSHDDKRTQLTFGDGHHLVIKGSLSEVKDIIFNSRGNIIP
jgi:sRNA-binding carbon storage regulator CsrA